MKKYDLLILSLTFIFVFGLWYKELGLVTYNNKLCHEYQAVVNNNSVKWYLTASEPNEVLYIKVVDDKGNISRLENMDMLK